MGQNHSQYLENVLNRYESYTYQWQLMMVHPQESTEFESLIDKGRVVTLAHSGVESEINIQSVQQDMTLTFAKQNRNAVGNMFTMQLIEPMGATMFNRIKLAALQLGIENHLQACYLLELKFNGWLPDGTASDSPPGPFYYMTTMSSLEFTYRQGASTYTAQLIETQQDAYKRLQLNLPFEGSINASTYGEFLQALETEINEQEVQRTSLDPHQTYSNTFHIDLGADAAHWKNWKFTAAINSGDNAAISIRGNGNLIFEFNPGTSIAALMSTALFQTEEFQKLPVHTKNGSGQFAKDSPTDAIAKETVMQNLLTWFKMDTKVTYNEYDNLTKHYRKDITYTIAQYITPEIVHDPTSYYNLMSSPKLQKQRLQKIFDNDLLRKRFDFTFTGLNTEVIDLDITMNNLYYQIQALNGGELNGRQVAGISSSDPLNVVNALRTDLLNLQSTISSKRARITQLNAQNEIPPQGPDDVINQHAASVDISNLESAVRQLEDQKDIINESLIAAQVELNAFGRESSRTGANPLSRRYITQSDVSSSNSALSSELPLTFQSTNIVSQSTSGPDQGNQSSGSLMLGAVEVGLNALSDLIEQNITVRGDPYWLGKQTRANNNSLGADYQSGGLNYFLNVKFPTYPEHETGLPRQIDNDFSIMGIYRVYMVRASYDQGSFTMQLSSFRDMNANVGSIWEDLERGFTTSQNGISQQESRRTGEGDGDDVDGLPDDGVSRDPDYTGPLVTGSGTGQIDDTSYQTEPGKIRNDPLSTRLRSQIQQAAQATGLDVVVYSGGQDSTGPNRTGSHRHDNGNAADIELFDGNRRLSFSDPNDLPLIKSFIQNGKSAGLTQFGAGNGYMGNRRIHVDATQPQLGYWGGQLDNGTYRARNAPEWLRTAVTG